MMHKKRTWCVTSVTHPEELARKLTERTWTLCTAFRLGDHVFVNDSTSENGAQEYAVLKHTADGGFFQVESVTFGWCSFEQALALIQKAQAGEFDNEARQVEVSLQTPEAHSSCHLCR